MPIIKNIWKITTIKTPIIRLGAFQFDVQHVPGDKNPWVKTSGHLPENLIRQEREDIEIETEEEDR